MLLHQDSEIIDPDFCAKLREALADPEVALVGSAGAVGVRSIAWWEGSVDLGSFTHRYSEYGGGEVPAMRWDPDNTTPWYADRRGRLDRRLRDGMSPWAIREASLRRGDRQQLHGYDYDICLQAREAGRKVVTRPACRPPSLARPDRRRPGLDRRPHQGGRQVGREVPGRRSPTGSTGSSAPGWRRPRWARRGFSCARSSTSQAPARPRPGSSTGSSRRRCWRCAPVGAGGSRRRCGRRTSAQEASPAAD